MTKIYFEDFEWDDFKNIMNIRKHGISFEEASEVLFNHPYKIYRHDRLGEKRFIIKGRVFSGERVSVVITIRGNNIRIISARREE
ncbi:MAG: BrnT family toxin [Candidatus Eremiobacteraeota bacterium]|nr:BrnT family toxin [Candidatus Eremiobacteraeota bacterium]